MQAWRSFSRGVLLVVAGLGIAVVAGAKRIRIPGDRSC